MELLRCRGKVEIVQSRGEVEIVPAHDSAVVVTSAERPELFEPIFERYHSKIWAYACRRAGPDCADDVTGDVFVTAFSRRASFDPGLGTVEGWLYGIASNHLRTWFRSEARAARAFRRVAAEQLVLALPPEEAAPDPDGPQKLRRVLAALAEMSMTDREIITLYAWEQLSYGEIAAALAVEVGTVRSRLSRSRGRLRELLGMSGESPIEIPFR